MLTRAGLLDRAGKDFAPFADAAGILVAVSGGPDSMALLRLAAQWAAAPGRPPVMAATVDHGLRADSRAETEQVAKWCETIGIRHHPLTWEGPKPEARIQERARDARYALLDACAASQGFDVLLTAHHMDDQAETILFRLMRGSGIAGLAGMERIVARGGLRHARPLLDWRKDELISVCVDLGQGFVTDPSNQNPRFARTRMRELSALLEPDGLDAPALSRLAGRARRADEALRITAESALKRLELPDSSDGIALDGAGLLAEPAEIAQRVLDACIHRATQSSVPTRLERLERLTEALLSALSDRAAFAATLGGAIIRAEPGMRVRVMAEPRPRSALVNNT